MSGFTSGYLLTTKGEVSLSSYSTTSNSSTTSSAIIATATAPPVQKLTNVVAVRMKPDILFSRSNDSGSVYYAVQGCMSYPVAIHNGTGSMYSKHRFGFNTHEVVSYGSNLSVALKWWRSQNPDIEEIMWI